MKKVKFEKKFIEELEKFPNISWVCEKLNISRQSIYRWMELDEKFKAKVDNACDLGRESICDLAENKLISNINSGNQKAIEFFLIANKKQYYRPRKPLPPPGMEFIPIREIRHELFDSNKHDYPGKNKDISYD